MDTTRTKGSELVIASVLVVGSLALLWRRPSPKPGVAADALHFSIPVAPSRVPRPEPFTSVKTPSAPTDFFAQRAADYDAIASFQRQGDYAGAARFALYAAAEFRRDLIIAAFVDWGRHDPDAALTNAIEISDPRARTLAFESLLTGWARTDPAELAKFALTFPAGPERDIALTKALREWMHRDPWTAGDWLLTQSRDVQDMAEQMFETENR